MKKNNVCCWPGQHKQYIIACFLALLSINGFTQTPYSCPSCDLRGHDFSGQDLTNANFSFAKLDNANFNNSTLNGAMFDNASMQSTSFRSAQINTSDKGPANFSKGNCSNADFTGASLQKAVFTFANLNGAIFDHSNLADTKFGLRLVLRDAQTPRPPSFKGTKLPCELKRFMRNDDLSKVEFLPCRTYIANKNKRRRKDTGDSVYVSPAGTDASGCGTAGNPCKTIDYAISVAPANGVIGLSADTFIMEKYVEVTKNLEFVGGLDDQNGWAPTPYQSSISGGLYGFPIFTVTAGTTQVSFTNLMMSGMKEGNRISSIVLQAYKGTTISFSDVNIYAGIPGDGLDGLSGAGPACCLMCHGPNYANCGPGGTANSSVNGFCSFPPLGWGGKSGGTGGSGTSDDCYMLCPGSGGSQGGGSFGILLSDATLNIDNTSTITAGAGSNGGAGGGGVVSAGGGAGGNGGPAACIGMHGQSTINGNYNAYTGKAGNPGKGGGSSYNQSKGCSGQNGQDGLPGVSAQVIRF